MEAGYFSLCITKSLERKYVRTMKNIVILDSNSFALNAIDDALVNVQPKNYSMLRLIQKLLTLKKPPRVIIMMEYAHVPTFKLICSMGVNYILSRTDSVKHIRDALQKSESRHSASPGLERMMAKVQLPAHFASSVQKLSPAEINILIDLLKGIPSWLVAKKRAVSIKTVSTHKLNALKKIGISNLNLFFANTSGNNGMNSITKQMA
jgi:DNA-binding NarL/FixJ family response regulator